MTDLAIRLVDDIGPWAEEWQSLTRRCAGNDYYLTCDWFSFLAAFLPAGSHSYLIARDGDALVGVLPLQVTVERWARIAKVRRLSLQGNLYSPHRDGMAPSDAIDRVADAMADWLLRNQSGVWDVLDLRSFPSQDGLTARLLASLTQRGCRVLDHGVTANVLLDLGESPDVQPYLRTRSKSQRQSVRTAINKLLREGQFACHLASRPEDDWDSAASRYLSVYASSWKEPEAIPDFHSRWIRSMAPKGSVRLFSLLQSSSPGEVEGKRGPFDLDNIRVTEGPIAPEWNTLAVALFVIDGKRAHFLKCAYDEAHNALSPGTILIWFAMSHMLRADSVTSVDFQKGLERYKLQWSKDTRQLSSVVVFPSRGLLAAAQAATLRGRGMLKAVLSRCRDVSRAVRLRFRSRNAAGLQDQDRGEMSP